MAKAIKDDFWTRIERERKEKAKEVKEDIRPLMYRLALAGHDTIDIEFHGSGDDGSIQEVTSDSETALTSELREQIEDWAYKLLEGTGVDWCNNEGGCGTIVIDTKKKTYNFEVWQYRQEEDLAAEGKVKVPPYDGAEIKEDAEEED